jgi:uncharacterized protein (TIRG00374 family)
MTGNWWKRYLPLIGVILFIYILLKLDVKSIVLNMASINVVYIPLILFIVFLTLILQTLKWWVIARKQKINVPFWEANRINLISIFYGSVTPSRLGTIIRAEYLKKYTRNIGKGISNFVLDKVLDLSSLFFLAVVFSYMFHEKIGSSFIIYPMVMLLAVSILTWIFLSKKRAKFLLGFVYNRFLPKKTKKKARSMFHSFYENIPKKRFLLVAFVINLLNWILIYISTWVVGLSIGIDLNLTHFLAILPLGTIIAQIPISINGLGTREAALISLFGLFGVGAVAVFSMSMLSIVFSTLIPSMVALFFLLGKRQEL